jgi:hypothetical protein
LVGRRGENLGKTEEEEVAGLPSFISSVEVIAESELHESLLSDEVSMVMGDPGSNDAADGDMGIWNLPRGTSW